MTTATVNRVQGIGRLREIASEWRAEDFGLPTSAVLRNCREATLPPILASDRGVACGRGPAGLVDTIALNAAVAMWICGRAASVREGIGEARELMLGGAVRRKIAATREFYRKR